MQGEKVMAEKTIPAPSAQQTDGDAEITRAQERHIPPPVEIYEAPGELVLLADLPGVSKENLELDVDDGTLTIHAKAEHTVPGEPIYREYELGSFFRQFELSDEIDTDKIKAEMKHGVLMLHLPMAEKAKPKQVEVKVSGSSRARSAARPATIK
jgi:HSP20 family protein